MRPADLMPALAEGEIDFKFPENPDWKAPASIAGVKYPEIIQRFDDFLAEHSGDVEALKNKYQISTDVESEYFGMEQWKVDFLKRQKSKQAE